MLIRAKFMCATASGGHALEKIIPAAIFLYHQALNDTTGKGYPISEWENLTEDYLHSYICSFLISIQWIKCLYPESRE
jgi:hypothetical protein